MYADRACCNFVLYQRFPVPVLDKAEKNCEDMSNALISAIIIIVSRIISSARESRRTSKVVEIHVAVKSFLDLLQRTDIIV
jgi:hypothetical protein